VAWRDGLFHGRSAIEEPPAEGASKQPRGFRAEILCNYTVSATVMVLVEDLCR